MATTLSVLASNPPAPSRLGPARVDPRGPRLAAVATTVVLAAVLITGSSWLLLAQALLFALGAVGRSPYGQIYARLVRPRLAPPVELEDTRPLRFAQTVGLVFTVVALAGLSLPTTVVTLLATAAALAAAFLNAAFGICLGCEAYLLIRRAAPASRRSASEHVTTEVPA